MFQGMNARDKHAGSAQLAHGTQLVEPGEVDSACVEFREALAIAVETDAPSVRILARLHLARVGGGDLTRALTEFGEHEPCTEHAAKIEARFLLFGAVSDTEHLKAARDLLGFLVDHAPEQHKEAALTNVALHRRIERAWQQHLAAP